MAKYSDYGTLSSRYVEEIAYSRSLEEARKAYGFPATLPESATLSAAMAELIAGSSLAVNVKSSGAIGDNVADDTVAIQDALDAANAAGGGYVLLPDGRYKTTAPLNIYKNTTLLGVGWQTSVIDAAHDGDALKSTWTTNGSTAAFITLRDFAIVCSRATNVGSGFAESAGTYIDIERVFVSGFRDQISLDQSELVTIRKCYTLQDAAHCRSGIWLVNGPDRVGGTNRGFTNGITIQDHQFNAVAGINLRDDGGTNLVVINCNFNGGDTAAEHVSRIGLQYIGGSSEGHTVRGLSFVRVQALSGVDVGPSRGINISGMLLNDIITYAITLGAGREGTIKGNIFRAATVGCIAITSDDVAGVEIGGNDKYVDAGTEVAGPFIAATQSRLDAQRITQLGMSRVAASLVAGLRTVTPVTMGATSTSEIVVVGSSVWCVNADGTNGEIVVVTAVTATTWTGTLATAKAADWQMFKSAGSSRDVLVPTLLNGWVNFGAGTYASAGYYKDGDGRVHLSGTISGGTATSGTTLLTLPLGYRPSSTMYFMVLSNNAVGRVDVTSAGDVVIQVGSNAYLSLSDISFRVGTP